MKCLHQDKINDIEKIICIYHNLVPNIEDINVVFNLLQKVASLKSELNLVRNKF